MSDRRSSADKKLQRGALQALLILLVAARVKHATAARPRNRDVPFRPLLWRKPRPLGYASTADSFYSVAAPVLAGFSVATLGVCLADSDKFRWPGPVLLALSLAALLLTAALQFGFHAQQHLYSPAQVRDWYDDEELTEERLVALQIEQDENYRRWQGWDRRATISYNAGISVFGLGLVFALLPEGEREATWYFRTLAALLLGGGVLLELLWTWRLHKEQR